MVAFKQSQSPKRTPPEDLDSSFQGCRSIACGWTSLPFGTPSNSSERTCNPCSRTAATWEAALDNRDSGKCSNDRKLASTGLTPAQRPMIEFVALSKNPSPAMWFMKETTGPSCGILGDTASMCSQQETPLRRAPWWREPRSGLECRAPGVTGQQAITQCCNAEQEEGPRAPEPHQEGGDQDGRIEIAVGADGGALQPQQSRRRSLRAHADGASQNPARGPGEVREEESERSLAIDLLLRFLRNVFVRVEGEKFFLNRPTQNEVTNWSYSELTPTGAAPSCEEEAREGGPLIAMVVKSDYLDQSCSSARGAWFAFTTAQESAKGPIGLDTSNLSDEPCLSSDKRARFGLQTSARNGGGLKIAAAAERLGSPLRSKIRNANGLLTSWRDSGALALSSCSALRFVCYRCCSVFKVFNASTGGLRLTRN
ncbi:hypothetical protein THAOC_29960 [Thalassiosira oceanica]|uniref:Uncharacterized protein n=1 Tax=Thalassiosira oceanica TaxID=159749 RepID=K0RCI3_THAOC|nr:hypothetical protein THAOC_29960 [Thalassiosira oceanica]|eukprot:EJK50925.1 hypothetical protein THAOC_29960 [Thalassiosira oceanica]